MLRAATGEPEGARCLGSTSPATPSNQSKESMKYAVCSSSKTHLRVLHKSEKLHGCGGENFCRPLEIWVLLKCLFHLQVGWEAPGIDFLEGSSRHGWVFFNEPTLTKCPCPDSWSGTVWGCCSRKVWGRAGGGGLQSLQSCEPGPGRVSAVLSDCFPSSLRSPPPGAPELRRQAEPCPGLSCGPARNRPGTPA